MYSQRTNQGQNVCTGPQDIFCLFFPLRVADKCTRHPVDVVWMHGGIPTAIKNTLKKMEQTWIFCVDVWVEGAMFEKGNQSGNGSWEIEVNGVLFEQVERVTNQRCVWPTDTNMHQCWLDWHVHRTATISGHSACVRCYCLNHWWCRVQTSNAWYDPWECPNETRKKMSFGGPKKKKKKKVVVYVWVEWAWWLFFWFTHFAKKKEEEFRFLTLVFTKK